MKSFHVAKLNTPVVDIATDQKGVLTMLTINSDHSKLYAFQPKGLNVDTGSPLEARWVAESRIADSAIFETLDVPVEILHSKVEDVPTGFSGIAVFFTYHVSGCVHVGIQPSQQNSKNETVNQENFDLRRLKGPCIPVLTEEERQVSQKEKPSPGVAPRFSNPSTSRKQPKF